MSEKPKKPTAARTRHRTRKKGGLAGFKAWFNEKTPEEWMAVVVKLIAAGVLSSVLQLLTASALWMPVEWREVITFGSSFIFLVFSEFMLHLGERYLVPAEPKEKNDLAETSNGAIFKTIFTLIFLAGFVVCMWYTNKMRMETVWTFTSPYAGWWEQQFGETAPGTSGAVSGEPAQKVKLSLPEFLNQDRSTMYFPTDIDDPGFAAYLIKQANDHNLRTGIRVTMDVQPMKLIDWAKGKGVAVREKYNFWFMLLHFGMILSIAGAWGLYNKPEEFAQEAVVNFFLRVFGRAA